MLPFEGRCPCLTACCTTASTLNTTAAHRTSERYARYMWRVHCTCRGGHLLKRRLLPQQPLQLLVPRLHKRYNRDSSFCKPKTCSRNSMSCSNSFFSLSDSTAAKHLSTMHTWVRHHTHWHTPLETKSHNCTTKETENPKTVANLQPASASSSSPWPLLASNHAPAP